MIRNKKLASPGKAVDDRAMPPPPPIPFILFPGWRMYRGFPWPVWAAGWLAIFKALLWLATDPMVPSPLAEIMAAKFILLLFPFLLAGIGVWNLRKWAAWVIVATSVLDLLFFIVFPDAARIIAGSSFIGLAIVLLTGVGPLGDVLLLAAAPSMFKHAGQNYRFRSLVASKSG